MNNQGNSLIELTIVLSLFTFFATISMGNLSFLDRIRVRSAAEKLVADIGFAQQKALVTGEPQSIDLQLHPLPKTIFISSTTFAGSKITAAATGVLCAGSVYLTDVQRIYGVTVPVGGAAAKIVRL